MIFVYECPTAPARRRYIAQFEKIADNLYVTVQGSSAEKARAKAELMHQFQTMEPTDRTGFNLKARLAAIEEEPAVAAPVKRRREDDLI